MGYGYCGYELDGEKFYAVAYGEKYLERFNFHLKKIPGPPYDENMNRVAEQAREWILNGKVSKVKYKLNVTEFEEKVYDTIIKIPKGYVTSYKAVAIHIGSRGYRAVGNAMNKNPIPLFIPCHRVISHDRGIGGYAGGTQIKEYLLSKEGVFLENGKIPNKNIINLDSL